MTQTSPTVDPSTANDDQDTPKKRRGRPPAGPAPCATCGEVFPRPSEMKKHAKTHDPDIPCKAHESGEVICDKMFADNKRMIRHLWVRHEDFAEDPINNVPDIRKSCPICGYKIKRGDNAKRHMEEVHGGRKRRSSRKE